MTRKDARPGPLRSSVPTRGRVDPSIAAEFPGLTFAWLDVDVATGSSPRPLRRRLAHESDRIRGADALTLVRRPIPSAHRVFFRQVGLDPQTTPTPIENIVATRIMRGGLRSDGRLADATTIALLETGIPVWALDRDGLSPDLRLEADGEALVVTDGGDLLVPLFMELPQRHAATSESSRARLFAVGVPGVSSMAVDEALWLAVQLADG